MSSLADNSYVIVIASLEKCCGKNHKLMPMGVWRENDLKASHVRQMPSDGVREPGEQQHIRPIRNLQAQR